MTHVNRIKPLRSHQWSTEFQAAVESSEASPTPAFAVSYSNWLEGGFSQFLFELPPTHSAAIDTKI